MEAIRAAWAQEEKLETGLARKLRRAANKVRRILRISQEPMSLEMPVGQEDSSLLGDFIEDDKIPGPVDAAARQLLKEQIHGALAVLNPREREVLEMRFGLTDGQEHTLEEVAALGVTRERIRRSRPRRCASCATPTAAIPCAITWSYEPSGFRHDLSMRLTYCPQCGEPLTLRTVGSRERSSARRAATFTTATPCPAWASSSRWKAASC